MYLPSALVGDYQDEVSHRNHKHHHRQNYLFLFEKNVLLKNGQQLLSELGAIESGLES